jgi:hypothetical protein
MSSWSLETSEEVILIEEGSLSMAFSMVSSQKGASKDSVRNGESI